MGSRLATRFTLIELLIVVAILSILASLLLPALTRAKDVARTADCANNEKQFGLSILLFADDYDSYLPNSIYNHTQASPYQDDLFPPESAVSGNWLGFAHPSASNNFWPYYSDAEGPMCKSHEQYATMHERFTNNRSSLSQWWLQAGTYKIPTQHFSVWYYNSGNSNFYDNKRRIGTIKDTSKTFMALECTEPVSSIRNNFASKGYSSSYSKFGFHHNQNTGFNALFFDGHVSFYTWKRDVLYSDYVSSYFTTDQLGRVNFE